MKPYARAHGGEPPTRPAGSVGHASGNGHVTELGADAPQRHDRMTMSGEAPGCAQPSAWMRDTVSSVVHTALAIMRKLMRAAR